MGAQHQAGDQASETIKWSSRQDERQQKIDGMTSEDAQFIQAHFIALLSSTRNPRDPRLDECYSY